MGIRFFCPNGHKLNVKDFQAGRKGYCPYCGVKLRIPFSSTRFSSRFLSRKSRQRKKGILNDVLPEEIDAPPPTPEDVAPFASASSSAGAEPAEGFDAPLVEAGDVVWYVRPPSGGQYGPADAELMREWLIEGRVGAHAFVWREGWDDWREAGKVFSWLTPSPAAFDLSDLIESPVEISNPKSTVKSGAKTGVKSGVGRRGGAKPPRVQYGAGSLKERRSRTALIITLVTAGAALAAAFLAIGLSQ